MDAGQTTCWTLIRGAANGVAADRNAFAARYEPVVRAYLLARWRGRAHAVDVDDAVQDVFVECFRSGGVLERVEVERGGGFRAFLYGVVRNVALRHETRPVRRPAPAGLSESGVDAPAASDDALSRVFDRAWAQAIMREAADRQAATAAAAGPEAQRRHELLRLRFHEGMPIREIARRWSADAVQLHREYAKARDEFRAALLEVIALHQPDAPPAIESEARRLLELLD